jgi:Tripartite tricarboxylate transporter TctB family
LDVKRTQKSEEYSHNNDAQADCRHAFGSNAMISSRLLALVCVLAGAVSVYESYRLWKGWAGAGLMPGIAALLFICIAVAFLLIRRPEAPVLPTISEMGSVGIITASFIAYITLVGLIGYLLSTWLVLSVVAKTTSDASMKAVIIWPGALAVGSFWLFRLIGTNLPSGVVGI